MQSKVIFLITGILTVVPFLYYFFAEFSNPKWDMTITERILSSFFQTVAPRTSGFRTVDISMMKGGSFTIMIALMIIGGAPGSTAGGIKTTTTAVLISSAVSVFRKKNHTHFFGRSIPDNSVNHAAAILLMYMILLIAGGFVISEIEALPMTDCLFETISAITTVGVSLGITSELGIVSQLILMMLMLIGRVGGLTLIYAAMSTNNVNVSKLPQEKIILG